MISKLKTLLYNDHAATKQLKVASVPMSCDHNPDVNRTEIVDTLDTITQTHPDIDLVIFGEMILGWYAPGHLPEYHRCISIPISQETLQVFFLWQDIIGFTCVLKFPRLMTEHYTTLRCC